MGRVTAGDDDVLVLVDSLAGPHPVRVAFSDGRLDLGDHAPAAVRGAGLRAVARATGCRPVLMRQVHGARVHEVDLAVDGTDPPTREALPEADGLVSAATGVALLARAADCVPVLLADAHTGLIGAAHAGRPGVLAGIVPAVVDTLRRRGAGRLTAWIGPHVCGACYEVPAAMRDEVADVVPQTWATTSWGTPSLDLGAGVRAQLEGAGCEVRVSGACTREDPAWPSYRRDGGAAGRFAGVVWRPA